MRRAILFRYTIWAKADHSTPLLTALDVPGTVDKHSEVAFGHEVPVNGNGTTNGHQVNLNGGEACCN